MHWSHYVAHFFGGVFLANAIPHLIAGINGHKLQTPFASPPFKGLSSPEVNVLWALINVGIAYVLLVRVSVLNLTSWTDWFAAFGGFGVMAIFCAGSFQRLRANAEN